jgi:hypothetical protein
VKTSETDSAKLSRTGSPGKCHPRRAADTKARGAPSPVDKARVLLERGLRIVPVKPGTKKPRVEGFGADNPGFTHPPERFRGDDEIAILCGPCPAGAERSDAWLLCLDLDGDLDRPRAAGALGTELPPTLATHMGKHLWYWVPPSSLRDSMGQWGGLLGVRSSWKAEGRAGKAPDVDVKWCGGYAVERGSAEAFDVEAIATLPDAALEAILRAPGAGRRRPESDAAGGDDAGPLLVSLANCEAEAEALIAAAVEEWPAPGGDAGYHDACKAFGGACRRAGVNRADTESLIADIVRATGSHEPATRIAGALDAWDRVERNDSRGAYGRTKLAELLTGDGASTLAALDAVQISPCRAWLSNSPQEFAIRWREANGVPEPERLQARFAAEWGLVRIHAGEIANPLPPVKWLCEPLGIASESGRPNVFAAQAGAGKTMTAQALGLAVASGSKLFGEWECTQGPVLHIDLDQGRRSTFRRYQQLAAGMGLDLRGLPLDVAISSLRFIDHKQINRKAVDALARFVEGSTLVIVDCLRALAAGVDENASEFGDTLLELQLISERTGVTWLVIHHGGKSEGSAVRGTSAIRDRAGCLWLLEQGGRWRHDKISEHDTEMRPDFTTAFAAAPGGPAGTRVTLSLVIDEDAAPERGMITQREREAVATFVARHSSGISLTQVELALHPTPRQRVRDTVRHMITEQEIQHEGKGRVARLYVTERGRTLVR